MSVLAAEYRVEQYADKLGDLLTVILSRMINKSDNREDLGGQVAALAAEAVGHMARFDRIEGFRW